MKNITKCPEFYIIVYRKIFSRILGGHAPCPVSYAYENITLKGQKVEAIFLSLGTNRQKTDIHY